MSKWQHNKWLVVLLHIAAWLVLFSLPYWLRPSYNENRGGFNNTQPGLVHLRYVLNNIVYVAFFYLNALVLIPKYIYQRQYKRYSLEIVVLFGAILVITWFVFFKLFHIKENSFNIKGHIFFNFFFFLFMLAASTAYRFITDQVRNERIAREKENENLKTELSLLRSQASPHFMFNVLNNMVALARKKSDLLEPSLMKFSSLMRYMLYEADEEKVLLEKETEYLQAYIDLQQQRFGKNVAVEVHIANPDALYEIEPMLLIPFVENAFKHGTGIIEAAQIIINLQATNNQLLFSVKNKYNPASVEVKDKTSGIGLANVKRRLDLLYGRQHQLTISKEDSWFTIHLQLKLN
ncbi:MAG: histidine kinase [Flavihumibacter sp.]|nr:histidine kinase [Flavihumibacter sp.]